MDKNNVTETKLKLVENILQNISRLDAAKTEFSMETQ